MEEGSNSNSNSNSNKGDDDHHNHLDLHHHLLLVDDLLIQILVCLPVISLLRFKTVCKSWRAIIESSDFIHLHATTTTIINNDYDSDSDSVGPLLFQFYRYSVRNMGRYWIREFFVLSGTVKNGCCYQDLGSLEERDDFPPMMVASCHGIICLHYEVPRDIALWNPATKQYRILPKSLPLPLDFGRPLNNDFVGFGFDTQTKDYKVLLITCFESDDSSETKKKNAVQVYTLRTNSWRWCANVDLPTYNVTYPPNQGFYRNGHYFFLAAQFYKTTSDYDDDGDVKICIKEVMISFDFSKETYRIIPIPTDGNIRLDIRRRDGKIVCVTALQSDDCKCQVYVLNDDVDDDTTNDEYSWTKLYETYLYRPRSPVGPMAFSKDGLCGILRGSDGYGLMSYNFETEERKDIQIANVSSADVQLERVQMYKESLVSIYPPHHDTTTF